MVRHPLQLYFLRSRCLHCVCVEGLDRCIALSLSLQLRLLAHRTAGLLIWHLPMGVGTRKCELEGGLSTGRSCIPMRHPLLPALFQILPATRLLLLHLVLLHSGRRVALGVGRYKFGFNLCHEFGRCLLHIISLMFLI